MKVLRLLAGCVDAFIVFFILTVSLNIMKIDALEHTLLVSCIGAVIFMFKDISGQSLGKRLFKLKIVNKDGQCPPKYILVLRNMLMILWAVDVIIILVAGKKLCDYIFRTGVVDSKSQN